MTAPAITASRAATELTSGGPAPPRPAARCARRRARRAAASGARPTTATGSGMPVCSTRRDTRTRRASCALLRRRRHRRHLRRPTRRPLPPLARPIRTLTLTLSPAPPRSQAGSRPQRHPLRRRHHRRLRRRRRHRRLHRLLLLPRAGAGVHATRSPGPASATGGIAEVAASVSRREAAYSGVSWYGVHAGRGQPINAMECGAWGGLVNHATFRERVVPRG